MLFFNLLSQPFCLFCLIYGFLFYCQNKKSDANKMQPTGIEPALKASEASVLSVRLRLQDCNIRIYYKCITHHYFVSYHRHAGLSSTFLNFTGFSRMACGNCNNSDYTGFACGIRFPCGKNARRTVTAAPPAILSFPITKCPQNALLRMVRVNCNYFSPCSRRSL